MSTLTYSDTPGFGAWVRTQFGYRSTVHINNTLQCSGQGGWIFDDRTKNFSFPSSLADEIDRAFQNVDEALRAAGGTGWNQVYRLNSYHMDFDPAVVTVLMHDGFKKWMGEHQCIWTEVGVTRLGADGMRVELEVCAFIGEGQ